MSEGRYIVVDELVRHEVWKRVCGAKVVNSFQSAYNDLGSETHAFLVVSPALLSAQELACLVQRCTNLWPACYIAIPTGIQQLGNYPEPDLRFRSVFKELLVLAVDLPTAIRRKAQNARETFSQVLDGMLAEPYERLLEMYPSHFQRFDQAWWLVDLERSAYKRQVFERIFVGLMEARQLGHIERLRNEYVAVGGSQRSLKELAQEHGFHELFGA